MKTNRVIFLVLCLTFSYLFIACDSMEDINRIYSEKEEKVYLGKVDSIKTFAGLNKIKITWYISSDPRIKNTIVYWNMRQDSIVKPFNREKSGVQKDSIIIENLSGSNYYFEFRNVNDRGESSLFSSATGTTLGKKHLESLKNRTPTSIEYDAETFNTTVVLSPTIPEDFLVYSELKYLDKDGKEVSLIIDRDSISFIMENVPRRGKFQLRSVFSVGFDNEIFYSNYDSYDVPAPELKTGFTRWNPPGIPYKDYYWAYSIEKMWDDDIDTFYLVVVEDLPYSFTFDLGRNLYVESIKLFQRQDIPFDIQNLKEFQVWGSDSPDVTNDFDGWTKLGDFEVIKPSGLPLGQNTAEDLAAAAAGHLFPVDSELPPVRYIRVVVQSCWLWTTIAVAELKFYGFHD